MHLTDLLGVLQESALSMISAITCDIRIDISDPAKGGCKARRCERKQRSRLTLFSNLTQWPDVRWTIGREIFLMNVGRQFDITMSVEDVIRSTISDSVPRQSALAVKLNEKSLRTQCCAPCHRQPGSTISCAGSRLRSLPNPILAMQYHVFASARSFGKQEK